MEWVATIPKGQKEVWNNLVRAVGNWREGIMTYFETDMPVTNACTESINRLAKDKNREGRGYTFEVMRARMLYTTKHKKKAPTAKVSPFYKKPSVTDCRTSQRNSTTGSIYQLSEDCMVDVLLAITLYY